MPKSTAPVLLAVALGVFIALGLVWSALYALTRWDGLHWGSVIVHSLEICSGAAPYRDVPIFYGPIPFYLFCGAGSLFSFSYLTVGIVTFAAYATIVVIWAIIAQRLDFYPSTITTFIVAALVVHPFVLYPWYDYIGGAFFSLALFVAMGRYTSHASALLAAFLFSGAVLTRVSYAIVVIAALLLLPLLRVIPIGRALRIAAWGVAIAVVYFLALYAIYGLPPAFVVGEITSNTLYISGAFPGWLNRLAHWLVQRQEILFTAGVAIGAAYFIDAALHREQHPAALALYLISLVTFVLHTHIFEFFRMISGTPFILLFGIQAVIETLSSSRNPLRARPFTTAAIAIFSGWVLIALVSAVLSYPLATGWRFRLDEVGAVSLSKPRTIEGITFYNRNQKRFYEKVHRLCQGKTVINQTSDVLIAGVCRDNPILVPDWLYETTVKLAAERPELNAKVTSEPRTLEPGEVMFTYTAPSEHLKSIVRLRNKRQDFFPQTIHVVTANEPTR